MSRNWTPFFWSAAFTLLVGCANHPTSYVDPDWAQTHPKDTLRIVFEEGHAENPDDLLDDLPEYATDVMEFFTPRFKKALHFSTEAVIPQVSVVPPNELKEGIVKVLYDEETIEVKRPKHLQDEHGVILTVAPWKFDRYVVTTPGYYSPGLNGMPGMYVAGTTTSYLRISGTYSYYDCDKKAFVGYGIISDLSKFNFTMDRSDWEKVVDQLPAILFKGTPYAISGSN